MGRKRYRQIRFCGLSGEVNKKAQKPPLILERWSVWVGVTIVLILIAYAIPVWNMLQHGPAGSVGFRTW